MERPGRLRSRVAFACLTAFALVTSTLTPPALARPAPLKPAPVKAAYVKSAPQPRKPGPIARFFAPAPEKDAAIVMDGATGKVLYYRNPDAIRYPASLTKMMTLYMLFEALQKGKVRMDTRITASVHASLQSPTKLGLQPGDEIPVETAIKALTVLSANDVASAIAEHLGGGNETYFASLMTEKAHQLGMKRSNFHNASGLPDSQQLTTAREMAILGRHLAYDFPQYFHYFSTPSFSWNGRVYATHDNLLNEFQGTDGIKTGFTGLSGFNLVSSVVRDNHHVIGVVMGGMTAASRDREMMRILSATFDEANRNPLMLADANVPWRGGKGPGGELFKSEQDPDAILVTALEPVAPNAKAPRSTQLALVAAGPRAPIKPSPRPVIQVASLQVGSGQIAPVQASPAPLAAAAGVLTNGKTPLITLKAASVSSQSPVAQALQTAALTAVRDVPSGEVEQGDVAGPAVQVVKPQPKIAESSPIKRWAVQIGAYANETLAQAELTTYAKQAFDVVGNAQRLVARYAAPNGHTLYRARFGLFAKDEARDICKRMTARGQTCYAAEQVD